MLQFALFPICQYDRQHVSEMTNEQRAREARNNHLVEVFTPDELAEYLNDENYPTDCWVATLDDFYFT